MLEGIKLILKGKQFVVFLAVDTRIVSRAIEYRYRQVLQTGRRRPAGELGMEYLAKIVQIPFLLPRPGTSQLEGLLRGRQPVTAQAMAGPPGLAAGREQADLGREMPERPDGEAVESGLRVPQRRTRLGVEREARPEESDDRWQTLALSDEDARTLVRLAHIATRNPRTYNRLGNELRLIQLLLHEEGSAERWQGRDREQLIKWLVLCDLWPAFGQYLVVDRGLEKAEQIKDGNRLLEVAQSPTVKGILGQRYDEQAIGRLHDFLAQEPPLRVEVVRELVPYTTNLTGIYE